jgi:hypothetical protein
MSRQRPYPAWFRSTALGLVALALSGCASTGGWVVSPAQSQADEQVSRDKEECDRSAMERAGPGPFGLGIGYGLIGGALFSLQGAASGASWGALSGGRGSTADGAWIGAAVGAGAGFLMGFVDGVEKGQAGKHRYLNSYESCLSERGYTVVRSGV